MGKYRIKELTNKYRNTTYQIQKKGFFGWHDVKDESYTKMMDAQDAFHRVATEVTEVKYYYKNDKYMRFIEGSESTETSTSASWVRTPR